MSKQAIKIAKNIVSYTPSSLRKRLGAGMAHALGTWAETTLNNVQGLLQVTQTSDITEREAIAASLAIVNHVFKVGRHLNNASDDFIDVALDMDALLDDTAIPAVGAYEWDNTKKAYFISDKRLYKSKAQKAIKEAAKLVKNLRAELNTTTFDFTHFRASPDGTFLSYGVQVRKHRNEARENGQIFVG